MKRVNYIPVLLALCLGCTLGVALSQPVYAKLDVLLKKLAGPAPVLTALPTTQTSTMPRNTGRVWGTLVSVDADAYTLMLETSKGQVRFNFDPSALTFTKNIARYDDSGLMIGRDRTDTALSDMESTLPIGTDVMVYYPYNEDGSLIATVVSF